MKQMIVTSPEDSDYQNQICYKGSLLQIAKVQWIILNVARW